MTETMDIWLRLHYESGQAPMISIRGLFRAEGLELVPGGEQNFGVWNRLEDTFYRRYPATRDRNHWDAFREAAVRLGYSVAREGSEAQEGQRRYLREASDTPARVEARSRMAAPGTMVRWAPTRPEGWVQAPAYPGDVGMDLAATEDTDCYPGGVTYVPLGVAFAAPPGHWILLLGRSSLAAKLGLACVPGVIDEGFRGEMLAGVYPIVQRPVLVEAGTRLVQAILMPSVVPFPTKVDELPSSERGTNGFGSSGGR